MDDYKGKEFLDLLYKNLYNGANFEHTVNLYDDKEKNNLKYIDRLEKIHGMLDIDYQKQFLKELYYEILMVWIKRE